jgi:hypothetical protein
VRDKRRRRPQRALGFVPTVIGALAWLRQRPKDWNMSDEDQDIFSAGEQPEPSPPQPLIPDDNRLIEPPAEQRQVSEGIDALHKGPIEPKPAKPMLKGPPAVIEGEEDRQHVPISALHEERERRQALERRLELLERRAQAPAQQPTAEQPYDPETMFTDPAGYTQRMEQQFAARQRTAEMNMDFRITEIASPDEWKVAWPAFLQTVSQVDAQGRGMHPLTYARVMNSATPGTEILAWHREQELKAEVGDDPKAYRDRVRQQLLDDDAFMAEVAGKLGVAAPPPRQVVDPRSRSPNGQFQAAAPARLPTSLSKVPGGTAAHGEPSALDGSDEAIWKAGNAPRRRK